MIRSRPPMYGRRTWGIVTEPSAFWYSSRIGIRTRGEAITVLFSVWQIQVLLVGLVPQVHPPGLEFVKPAGRVRLAEALARRHPRLDVEFLHLPAAQVARADIDHPVGQFQRLQHALGVGQNFLVVLFAFLLVVLADDDLLDLVELVNAVQAVGVLARRARLAAKTGAQRHRLDRQLRRR